MGRSTKNPWARSISGTSSVTSGINVSPAGTATTSRACGEVSSMATTLPTDEPSGLRTSSPTSSSGQYSSFPSGRRSTAGMNRSAFPNASEALRSLISSKRINNPFSVARAAPTVRRSFAAVKTTCPRWNRLARSE